MRSVSPFERFSTFVPVEDANMTVHVYTAGESLTGLAHRYYGDWREWKRIADRNSVVDARRIEPGTQLVIPAIPPQKGEFESL
jgi:nucleoid-associated protein YgaU